MTRNFSEDFSISNNFRTAGTAHQKPKRQSAKREPPDNFFALQRLLAVSGIRPVPPVRPDRSLEIMNGFTRLLIEQEYPVRKPEYYAERLSITKGHLADVVKDKSGKTTMDWINERTILLAQAMLASTDEVIEKIGENLYIGDASQFIKFFKKHTGETPNEYRRRMNA